ncbi:hypothetical protein [Leptolyngbya sp. PCC 6406]|uniref:hypothetical protein n=1 Tax=Leptolyngbya sp. PCC 6406 TaxID=1173264 RepID=UPI0002ABC266|nr:hypothetical protein [Leptolyngbya sp. PCC 6406]
MAERYLEQISIGDRLHPAQEAEGSRLTWMDSACELHISLSNLNAAEIRGVERGVFEFGLNIIEQMPFVCYRILELLPTKGFGKHIQAKVVLPWQECPFHLSRFDPDVLPHFDEFRAEPDARLAIATILTTWPGMTVKGLRFFTLSPFFTQRLIDALLGTAAAYTRESYADAVTRIYQAYPVNSIGEGSRVRCKSGD